MTRKADYIVRLAAAACAIAAGVMIAATLLEYKGSPALMAAFHLGYLLVVVLVLPRPRLYVYTFLAAFLFLGFWVKVVVHTIWGVGFIEPVGKFTGTPVEWDSALAVALCSAAGIILARFVHLVIARRVTPPADAVHANIPPEWFRRFRRPVWLSSLGLVIVLNAANMQFAFSQIGVNQQVILPWHLTVLVMWLINIGFALWIATLVHWDFRIRADSLARTLGAPILEAVFSSVSSLSRLFFLTHAAPYALALFEHWKDMGPHLKRWSALLLAGAFTAILCLSIYLVFAFRVFSYAYEMSLPDAPPNYSPEQHLRKIIRLQGPHLFFHRWVGLEGVLAIGSTEDRGRELFVAAWTNDAKLGSRSLYQQLANTGFLSKDPARFTFLSNAGVVALLWCSGSLPVVALGMALLMGLLIATELMAKRHTGNPFLLAVGGAGLTTVASQMTFPYLGMIYLLQFWVAIVFLSVIQRIRFNFGGSGGVERPGAERAGPATP